MTLFAHERIYERSLSPMLWLADGRLLIAGGLNKAGTGFHAETEVFTPGVGFAPYTPMLEGDFYFCLAEVPGERVMTFGAAAG